MPSKRGSSDAGAQGDAHLDVLKTSAFKKGSKEKEKEKEEKKKITKKRKAKGLLSGMVEKLSEDLFKYWVRRSSLFSRFDDGIKCDEQGLFSVTPEEIAKHQAELCGSGNVVIDAFTGVGGNAIQFASRQNHVVAIDIDPTRIRCARHNAKVYDVAHNIDFMVGDFFRLAPSLKADVIFLSPPWGGPKYKAARTYDIETMLQPKNGFILFSVALLVAPSVVLFLPRTVDMEQLAQLAWLANPPLAYKVEKNFENGYLKAVTVYYGDVATHQAATSTDSELHTSVYVSRLQCT